MNPTSGDPTAPPPPAQPPRSSFRCDRHPIEQFTGFCSSCLCERLTTLDQSSSNTPSSSRRPSSASAAIKSLFSKPNNPAPPPPPPAAAAAPKPSSFFPELRRTKSFSVSKNEALALGLSFEPQRKSCDVRARNTLSSLFTIDDGGKNIPVSISHHNLQINKKIESCVANKPVLEETENEEDFKDPDNLDDVVLCADDNSDGDYIGPVRDTHSESLINPVEIKTNSGEIVEEEEEEEVQVASVCNSTSSISKPMKDHINLDPQEKKSGFWAAASVFSKKWHQWRRKQKIKKATNGEDNFATLPVEKPISRQFRETQSEIADYGFGRRSCDTGPRFSLDAGRISLDGPRYSFDEPRASWDGYMVGKSFPRMVAPPMVSVMEDAPNRPDMQIPVVEGSLVNCGGEGDKVVLPGGSIQTREYYLDSSSRRRKSLDRSSSMRTSLAGDIDEVKSLASNARVSPTTADGFHGAEVMAGEKNSNNNNSRDLNSNSLRDDCSETFELGTNRFIRESSNSLIGSADIKDSKKSRRWSWRIWGFIHRRNNNNKDEDDEEKYSGRLKTVERSLSESWQDLRPESGDLRGPQLSRNMFRSNSSVSWRNNNGNHHVGGSFGSMRKSCAEVNGKRSKDEFVLERNQSARYSPNNIDNGLLRFYLTPMRNSWRGGGGLTKVKPNNSHSIARSVLRLY